MSLSMSGPATRMRRTSVETSCEDGVPMEKFAGVSVKDLYRVETTFQTNVCVYSLVKPNENDDERPTAELIRRSICKYPTTLYLNLHETHFSFISDVRMYCHSYRCRTCNSLWKRTWNLRVHESTCNGFCTSSLSRRRVPFHAVDIRTTGRREHPSERVVAVLPVQSHF